MTSPTIKPIKQAEYTAEQIADYFVYLASQKMADENTPEGISPLKLQKLLYFGQAASLALFDKKLFKEDIEAWKYGPVVPVIYRKYKFKQNQPLLKPKGVYKEIKNMEVKNILEGVWELFDKYSASELVEITHQHTPWKNTYKENENIVIPPKILRDYYKNIFELKESN